MEHSAKVGGMPAAQPYYFIDSAFQLELNLQSLRRELITFLECDTDCQTCDKIKCRCKGTKGPDKTITVSTVTDPDQETPTEGAGETSKVQGLQGTDKKMLMSPPASSLPKPQWDCASSGTSKASINTAEVTSNLKSTEAWVKALNVAEKEDKESLNPSWLTKSVWADKVGSASQFHSPIHGFFKALGQANLPKTGPAQVNRFVPALMYKMMRDPQSSCYNYF